MSSVHLWIREESRPTEQRVPIVPEDAALLVAEGVRVTVERSQRRAYRDEEFAAAGCELADPGSWVAAPEDAYIVGIKELPPEPEPLHHHHIFFAHAYKGQEGAERLLHRFRSGGGELLDVEYLTVDGRRVVAFGYWAGYVGAALGALAWQDALRPPLQPTTQQDLDDRIAAGSPGRAVVIGAGGRSGRGSVAALTAAGWEVTQWDRRQTQPLDRPALLDHDLLVNCVMTKTSTPPFLTHEDLAGDEHRLRVVADVTCDVTSEHNLLPVNTAITTWELPVRRVHQGQHPVDVIAIDNLPSLLPREASRSFSAELIPLVRDLPARRGPWAAAKEAFSSALGALRH
ncbi:Rossmann-fold NAD(P)-binding domain-containing protein [Ornithinicoccus halotolerans]|uniref:saccharopine dehydrogenase n=1 Tax=Ornithinicoccus halotolerans TaxID=1748220 RepID=UPI001297AF0F|nr:saccharopine dehydrogenase [Ornithinicoccus halotolerans]